jgi:hypothetical protein
MAVGHRVAGASALLLLLSGCYGRTVTPYTGPEAAGHRAWSRPASWRPQVEAAPAFQPNLEPVGRAGRHEVLALSARSVGFNAQPDGMVEALYYRVPGTVARPLVLILPIWARSTYPSRVTLARLLRLDPPMHVLMLRGEALLFDWDAIAAAQDKEDLLAAVELSAGAYRTTVEDVRRLLRWAAARPEVDGRRLGIAGFSLGAVFGSLVMGVEPRLAAGAFVMGGADLPRIFAECLNRNAPSRAAMLARMGWSQSDFKEAVRPYLEPLDPIPYAASIDPSRVLLVEAADDGCLSQEGRDELWQAMGQPTRIEIASGHRRSFLTMTPVGLHRTTRWVVRFLDERLTGPPAAGSASSATTGARAAGDKR